MKGYEEVFDRYYDTAGNLHWIGAETGKHIVRFNYRVGDVQTQFVPVDFSKLQEKEFYERANKR